MSKLRIYKPITYFSKTRVEAFSDGIFAVIITLLVLDIRIPKITDQNSVTQLAAAVLHIFPKILSWIVSFLIVCVIWVNHHRVFDELKYVTHGIFWLNANLLLWCSLIPFPTALIGDYINNPVSLLSFGIILSLMAFAFYLLRMNILENGSILNEEVDLVAFKQMTEKSLIFGPVLYITGALSSFIHPYISFSIYFFVPLYFIFNNNNPAKNENSSDRIR